jgi:predicted nucleic acid-binding protein
MAVKVIDASALAAILYAEPEADMVAAAAGDATLAAPALIEYELGNVCWKKIRRHPQQAEALRAAFNTMSEMELQLHDVEPGSVLALAASAGITYYDASYLWLAERLAVPLISLDRRLRDR